MLLFKWRFVSFHNIVCGNMIAAQCTGMYSCALEYWVVANINELSLLLANSDVSFYPCHWSLKRAVQWLFCHQSHWGTWARNSCFRPCFHSRDLSKKQLFHAMLSFPWLEQQTAASCHAFIPVTWARNSCFMPCFHSRDLSKKQLLHAMLSFPWLEQETAASCHAFIPVTWARNSCTLCHTFNLLSFTCLSYR